MQDEIKRILNMVQEGKLSAEEGAKLIEALKEKTAERVKGKYFRIKVESEGDRVNIKLPLTLMKFATKFIPKDKGFVEIGGKKLDISLDEVIEALLEKPDEIVSVESEDGTIVKIWIE